MGQRIAKHHMQSGVKLYHQRCYQQAIARWRAALRRITNAEDRFITLGYMVQAYCDTGNYQKMLQYALQQTELANNQQDELMKSEAFLNLAKAYERLADFGRAIGYARASLQYSSIDPRTPGQAHLVVALSQLGFSQFQASLEAFEKAMCVANQCSDKLLELQVCIGLGILFTLLRDFSKAILFLRNALAILDGVTINDMHAKYRSIVLYHLSVVLRRNGSLINARAMCDEALKLAQETGNRSVYARCLCSMADICRDLGESEAKETLTKSWSRYETAYRIMRQTNDRMGEVLVLGSMAKSASECRTLYTGRCECQAIQLDKKCLEVAKAIGCRYAMMKCHQRLQDHYNQLNDEDSEESTRRVITSLVQEMELFCNFCGQRYGLHDDSLQALRCSHIFHERCLQTYLAECTDPNCPKCQCKAVLMNSVSVSTLSVSSMIASQQLPNIFSDDTPMQFTDRTIELFDTAGPSVIEEQALGQRLPVSLSIASTSTQFNSPKHKSSPLPSKQFVCKIDGTLPVSSVLNYSEEQLREGERKGELVLSRNLTVTDV
ncbi:unnamed protein product [Cercopithifilaria johnstoni]|uniref:Uncharacterized protein n=1 Tax=Cercopithifilaria johnstoni TaxID=2874296 RepID=A0A8J2ML06_9BILA|nr:unnamed protein product [Cercopithifilaria johnstoni]